MIVSFMFSRLAGQGFAPNIRTSPAPIAVPNVVILPSECTSSSRSTAVIAPKAHIARVTLPRLFTRVSDVSVFGGLLAMLLKMCLV